METVPRMTRSRARAEASKTPQPGVQTTKTPARSTRASRKKQEEEEADVQPQELFRDTSAESEAPSVPPASDVQDQGEQSPSAGVDLGRLDTAAAEAPPATPAAADISTVQQALAVEVNNNEGMAPMAAIPLSPAVAEPVAVLNMDQHAAPVTEELLSTAAPADITFAVPANQEFQFELPGTTNAELGSMAGFMDNELCEDDIEWPDEALNEDEAVDECGMDMEGAGCQTPADLSLLADIPPTPVVAPPLSEEAVTAVDPAPLALSPLPMAAATPVAEPEPQQASDAMEEDMEEAPLSPAPSPESELEPVSPVAAALDISSPVQDRAAAAPVSKFVSKTPQPATRSAASAAAKHSLTAIKPGAATSKVSLTPGPVPYKAATRSATAAAAAEQHHVKFTTPSKDTPAATSSRKGVLKPSTQFATPGAATAGKTRDATSTKSAKRVSISTPVHPKSAGGSRGIVRTPYPKSASKDDEDEVGCEEQQEDACMEQDSLKLATRQPPAFDDAAAAVEEQDTCLQHDSALPGAVAADEGEDVVAAGVMPVEDECIDDAHMDDQQEEEVEEEEAVVAAGGPSAAADKGLAALKSLAAAEEAAHSRPAAAHVPHYMAPTSAALSRSRLKSQVVVPDTYDPRSLNQIRKQIKQVTSGKPGATTTTTTTTSAATSSKPKSSSGVKAGQDLTSMRKTKLIEKAKPEKRSSLVHDEDDVLDQRELPHNKASEDLLTAALDKLNIGPQPAGGKVAPLKGLPVPQGRHVRFNSKGKPVDSPSSGKPQLRGLPAATGTHLRFKE